MLRRWARVFVALATMLAAWVVATPARASEAPLCDIRGATTFAPAPQLQAPDTSIDVGMDEEGCLDGLARQHAVESGHAPSPAPAGVTVDAAVPQATTGIVASPWVPTRAARESRDEARAGVRSRVDRPPR